MSDGLNLLAEAVEPKDQQQGNSCYCQYVNVHGVSLVALRYMRPTFSPRASMTS
jgi:hypothetical protein